MKKILIVDDDMEILRLMGKKLKQSKFKVLAATSGKEALIIAETSQPDLILLDIAMPEMDGYQTCEKLRQDSKTKDLRVLFLTGKELEPEGINQRCQDLGACGHISKLSSLKDLTQKIKEALSE